MVTNMAIYKC